MIIRIDPAGAVTLTSGDDFTAFHIAGDERGAAASRARLADAGIDLVADSSHAWVEPSAVRRLAGASADEGWERSFDAMVEYAASKGWTDDEGRVRAHCVWDPPGGD